jgi:hypothetical protein
MREPRRTDSARKRLNKRYKCQRITLWGYRTQEVEAGRDAWDGQSLNWFETEWHLDAAVGTISVIAACAPGEAVWLGFQPVDVASPAIVRVRADSPQPVDAVTGERWEDGLSDQPRNHLVCPPDSRLLGVRHPDGFVPFGADQSFSVLCYRESDTCVHVELVSPEKFTSVTGLTPEPLDPDSAYKGWLLP